MQDPNPPLNHRKELEDLDQWVMWQYETVAARSPDKPTKVPYTPALREKRRASTTDPETWDSYKVASMLFPRTTFDGLGFVFTEDDPYVGVDLDDAFEETGEIKGWAEHVYDFLDSYSELSPSGTGLHVIVRGSVPEGGNSRVLTDDEGNPVGKLEMYDAGRYFTMTGTAIGNRPIADRAEELAAIHAKYIHRPAPTTPSAPAHTAPPARSVPVELDDANLLVKARQAKNGPKFSDLYDMGDTSAHGGDDSSADLALCNMLAYWTGKDPDRMDALFRRSALMRPKWDEKRGALTYGQKTVGQAIAKTTDTYDPSYRSMTDDSNDGNVRGAVMPPNDGMTAMTATSTDNAISVRGGMTAGSAIPEGPTPKVVSPMSLRHTPAHPFPTHVLPEPMRALVEEVSRSMDCHPDLVAIPALFAAATAIGNKRKGKPKEDWSEYPSLFLGVVASPGSMKTPAANPALAPLRHIQKSYNAGFADKMVAHEREMREYEAAKRTALAAKETPPPPPEPPMPKQILVSDTTWEAMTDVLLINRAVGVHYDELSGWIRSMDQYKSAGKGAERQNWLSVWGSEDIIQNRRQTLGPIHIEEPCVSVYGGIQPAMLGELGQGNTDGLLDRFLLGYVPNKMVLQQDFVVEKTTINRYDWFIASLNELKTPTVGEPKEIRFSEEAKFLFRRRVDSLSRESQAKGFPIQLEAFWAKLRGYTARLATLLYVGRKCAAREEEEAIEVQDVDAAWELVEYFKSHVKRVHGIIQDSDPTDALARALRALLEAQEGNEWEGTASELLDRLHETPTEDLPQTVAVLGRRIKDVITRYPEIEAHAKRTEERRLIRLALVTKTA